MTERIQREIDHCPSWDRPELVAADLTTFMRKT
jgi:hypothetical protein